MAIRRVRGGRETGGLLGIVVMLVAVAAPVTAGEAGAVTFTKDIALILQRSCQRCHRPGSIAPMSLMTYDDARPWARAIKYRTGLRSKPGVMPPWFIEKDVGIQEFRDDISLSDGEVQKIAAWADAGAPQGDPADMPPALVFPDEVQWEIGEPDLIVSSPSFEVRASDPDWWGGLGEAPTGLTEDRYLAAVEYKEVTEYRDPNAEKRDTVGGAYVLHHSVLSLRSPGSNGFGGFPPHNLGRNAQTLNPEVGWLFKADSSVGFDSMHLHSNGVDTRAHLEIGLKFHPRGYEPKYENAGATFGNGPDLDIAPMDANQRVEAYFTLPEHTKLYNFEPHMHAPGVRMCMEAVYGITKETLNCSGYDHNWALVYVYEDDVAPLLPKGTILHLIGYFNNSPSNPNVVDPRNWSGGGHRSVDNMFINLLEAAYLTDEQFAEEMDKRREQMELGEWESVIGCPLCGAPETSSPVEQQAWRSRAVGALRGSP